MENLSPRYFGLYEVIETIGRGSSATVYKARQTQTGEIVALKAGPRFMTLEPGALERFQREFSAIRDLRHPNLVAAQAIHEHDGTPYIVMEYVPGQNLEQRLKTDGPIAMDKAIPLFLQLAQGLRHLHEHYLLHRDIKPSNIFLNGADQAKLGDFGILKDMTAPEQLTLSRRGMGTMEYGAPEQFEDARSVDSRCDLYSLAATLYTVLTGKFPFGNGGNLQVMQRKLLKQYVPLRLLLPSLDPAIDRLVNICLAPKSGDRPGSCDDLISILREIKPHAAANADDEKMVSDGGTAASGPERRASVRFQVDLTTTFVPFHQNMRGRWQAAILDVSSTGVRLQTSRPVAVNSVLQITLGESAITELVLVRWVKAGERDTLIIGCAFVQPLVQDQLDAIYRQNARQTPPSPVQPTSSP
jgi:serine/threonine protein kinase